MKQRPKIKYILWTTIILAVVGIGALTIGSNVLQKGKVTVETPYCTLQYPTEWETLVRTKVYKDDPYTVSYCAVLDGKSEIPLFDISFGIQGEGYLGNILMENGEVVSVVLKMHDDGTDDSWTQEDKNTIYTMRDDVNYLIDRLPLLEEPEVTEELVAIEETEPVMYEDVIIETPYISFVYPGEWSNSIRVTSQTEEGYHLIFSGIVDEHSEQPLFELYFKEEIQGNLGMISGENGMTVGVDLSIFELAADDSWTTEQIASFTAMQDFLNIIVSQLDFVDETEEIIEEEIEPDIVEIPQTTATEYVGEDIVVHTEYCDLAYPGYWRNQVRTEYVSDEYIRVDYYGSANGKLEHLLFTISFTYGKGMMLGMIVDQQGNEIPVSIDIYELEKDASETEEEFREILAMQEDLNYLIQSLELVS